MGSAAYDGVWVWAKALHQLIANGKTLLELRRDPTLLYEQLRATTFFGASGAIAFDGNGDRLGFRVKIENNQAGGVETQVAWFSDGITMWPGAVIQWWHNITLGKDDPSFQPAVPPRAPGLVHLAHFSPLTGGWSGGGDMEPFARLALADVNTNAAVLPQYVLARSFHDSGCDSGIAGKALIDSTIDDATKHVVGIIGPGCRCDDAYQVQVYSYM